MLSIILMSFLASGVALQLPFELREAVTGYWSALAKKDKAGAMRFVHPEDLNNFLNRNEAPFTGWRLGESPWVGEGPHPVTVSIDRVFPELGGVVRPVEVTETWERTDDGWRVRVASLAEMRDEAWKRIQAMSQTPFPPRVDVFPKTLKFYSFAPDQPGVVTIRNGLEIPVEVLGLEIDEGGFRVTSQPEKVAPKTVGRISVMHEGTAAEMSEVKPFRLKVKVGEEVKSFSIPVILGYEDGVTRWIIRQKKPDAPPKPPRG